jgi:hypothetical protein
MRHVFEIPNATLYGSLIAYSDIYNLPVKPGFLANWNFFSS